MASATMIELDGAAGEGGGQMLRSALTLSMLTGKALHMRNIRAGRAKPGLLRQHLTAVPAAAQISAARVDGAVPSSRELQFVPGPVRAGHYRFAIGTAGSCTLVLQTVLPALWFADGPSEVHVTGGTHNPLAPPVNFLQLAWVPLLTRMGAKLSIELIRHGFYPAGGGEVRAIIEPAAPVPIELDEPGAAVEATIIALVAGVPRDVAEREVERLLAEFPEATVDIRQLPQREGPGNAVSLVLRHANVTEVFCRFGERRKSAVAVANDVVRDARAWFRSRSAVGPYLADQLLLPLALTRGGSFTTTAPTAHLRSNIDVIERFLPVRFDVDAITPSKVRWRVALRVSQ